MLGSLLVIIIIAGFALYQYVKGGIVSGFIFLIAAITAAIAAFSYYELAASYITAYSFIGAKSFSIAFIVLFLVVFTVVREISVKLIKPDISFGSPIDKFVGTGIGAAAGYIVAGVILITIGLMPYKTNWIYSRFSDKVDNPPLSSGVFLNPDAFVTKLFGLFSSGSLKGQNSFAVVHADYIDQIFLNRLLVSDNISPLARDGAIRIVPQGVRLAPENLMEAPKEQETAQPVEPPSGKSIVLVGLRISGPSLAPAEGDQQKLVLSQLRLVSASGQVAYPIGYLNSERQLVVKPLNASLSDELKAEKIDFVFYIPKDTAPVALEFRQNIIEKINRVEPAEEFIPAKTDFASPNEPASEPTAEPNY
jgi:uncharacterized membrane protein required for colicin V production